jgi:hypothetical protein
MAFLPMRAIRRWRSHTSPIKEGRSPEALSIASNSAAKSFESASEQLRAASAAISPSSSWRTAAASATDSTDGVPSMKLLSTRMKWLPSATNMPPPGPGRTLTTPRSRRIRTASLTVARAKPESTRSSSRVDIFAPGANPSSMILCSTRSTSCSARVGMDGRICSAYRPPSPSEGEMKSTNRWSCDAGLYRRRYRELGYAGQAGIGMTYHYLTVKAWPRYSSECEACVPALALGRRPHPWTDGIGW